jgi:hypothetical protein
MPLSTGALWPTLRPLGTAGADDMTSKFEWAEGNRYPMSGGGLTTGAFDIGSASNEWDKGHFVEIDSPSMVFATVDSGNHIRAWANVDVAGGTLTMAQSFNISSITYVAGAPGVYTPIVSNYLPAVPITTGTYQMIKHTPKTSSPFISSIVYSTHMPKTFNMAGAGADSGFCIMILGPMNFTE